MEGKIEEQMFLVGRVEVLYGGRFVGRCVGRCVGRFVGRFVGRVVDMLVTLFSRSGRVVSDII